MSTAFDLDLSGRRVLVVGGGPVAALRVADLRAEGAEVVVHAETICEDLRDAYADGAIRWSPVEPDESAVAEAWLISLQDGIDDDVRTRVAALAHAHRVWCEGADARVYDGVDLDAFVAENDLSLRPAPHDGRVVLVGGGPGADDLITVRGRRELAKADVVVTDRLAPLGLVRRLAAHAEIIDVGKTPYHHPVPQHEINAILVDRARRGQYVVRLKGGDPFVLGRGGEEWLACRDAGIEVEVVPGISSAFAAPLAGLIPVTHRGVASGVLTISGHDEVSPELLAQWPHTIVVLMGMGRLAELCANLIRAGKSPMTAVAVVHRAYSDQQLIVRGTLGDITAQVLAAQMGNPSVIVIGDVVGQLS
ncbi:uroporphyrinogen-III C-methyltransferase [Calidifontibacter terrae]